MNIYKITNTVNNKIYIGKDQYDKENYMGSGVLIKRAQKKYGINNFTKEILEICEDAETLIEREKYWIKKFNSQDLTIGYNITSGGDGGDTISNHPELDKIKNKISEAGKGRVFSEEHCSNLSKAGKGKTHTEETKAKLKKPKSEAHKQKLRDAATKQWLKQKEAGYKHSEEHRKLLSERAKKRWAKRRESGELDTEEFKEKVRKAQQASAEAKRKKKIK